MVREMPINKGMSTSAINNLTSNYLQTIINNELQNANSVSNNSSSSVSAFSTSALQSQSDNTGISPFAQLLSTLQQLQQSNPTEYQQLTQQIATNLQSAAQTAQSQGNSTAASQLNQLASVFSNASQSGQLPNIQGLAQALGGHHHHHHSQGGGSDSDSSSSSSTANTTSSSSSSTGASSGNQALNQLLAAFQGTNTPANDPFNPMSIILNTLSSAGVNISGD